MAIPAQLLNNPGAAFYTARGTKSSAAIYLRQYIQHRSVAASRGLIPGGNLHGNGTSTSRVQQARAEHIAATTISSSDDYSDRHHQETDELVLARLKKAQSSLEAHLRQLDTDLARLEENLLATRKVVWVRTTFLALVFAIFLAMTTSMRRLSGTVARGLQQYLPLAPTPFAAFYIIARERQISAVAASRSHIDDLRVAVSSSQGVSSGDLDWLSKEEWDGVDFKRIGI